MIEKIEALRKEPRHVRNRYAFWIAFFFTLVIALVWGLTLPSRFAHTEQKEQPEEPSGSSFMREISGVARSIREAFSGIMVENSASSTPQKDDSIDFRTYLSSSTQPQTPETQGATASSAALAPASTTEKSR